MFTIVCTGINMYIHGIDLYIPLCQILSIWSGFQMGKFNNALQKIDYGCRKPFPSTWRSPRIKSRRTKGDPQTKTRQYYRWSNPEN